MTFPYSANIAVADRRDLDKQLDAAVQMAISDSLRNPGGGILVTRSDDWNLCVQVTSEVPFGTILERDLRQPRRFEAHHDSANS